jgi:hypothetical protein
MVMDLFVLIHSPLVGPLTWSLVAEQMRQRGLQVAVPVLNDSSEPSTPFWQQHTYSVSSVFSDLSKDISIVLVAHSGAGPLLPAIRNSIPNPVRAYVFVDAGIPRDGFTRLDLMKLEDEIWANDFQKELENGAKFPSWSAEDLQEIIVDQTLRRKMISELHPRKSDFFTEPIPVFDGWPDAPCIYVQFSSSYDWDAGRAREAGWSVYTLQANHFHMLVDPQEVADLVIESVRAL